MRHASSHPDALHELHAAAHKDGFPLPELYYGDPEGHLRAGHPVHATTYGHPAALRELRHASRNTHSVQHVHPTGHQDALPLPELCYIDPEGYL